MFFSNFCYSFHVRPIMFMRYHFLKFLLALCLTCCATLSIEAQHVRINGAVSAGVGEPVRIQYIINQNDVTLTSPPSIQGSGVECVSGPNIAIQNSVSVSVGSGGARRSANKSTTISFTYVADKATTITLSPATFEVNGQTLKSGTHRIQFTANSTTSSTSPTQGNATPSKIGAKGIIIRTLVNKRSVYEQEPIALSYRVLSLVNLASLSGGLPSLKEFLRQDVPLPQDKQVTAENINGKLYRSILWSQHVLFPQQAGKLTIPSFELQGVTQEVDHSIDPLDAFFNGGSALITTPFVRATESVAIEVKPLPSNKPTDFSGGVGQFTMQVESPTTPARTNDAYRLRITINGLGNHKLITAPKVVFPKSFQTFDTKSSVQTELTPEGLRGSITFDYTAVPKATGKFEIPAITFVYFDTQQEQFRTLQSDGFTLEVEQGSEKATSIDGARPDDIAPLRLDAGRSITSTDATLNTLVLFLGLLGVIIAFSTAFFLLRKEIAARSNKTLQRQRRAFATAQQALRQLPTDNSSSFYSKLSKIIHTYITHRMASATPVLSTEQGRLLLSECHVPEAVISRYEALITRSEQAAYAGHTAAASLDNERIEALTIIQHIEQIQHD